MLNTSRRKFLATTGAAALGATLGTFQRAAFAQGALIRSTHFGGPYQILNDIIAKPFAAAGLGRVEYDVEVSPSVIAKLQAQRGNPPFDVVMVSRSFGLRALNAGLVEQISAADFPEAKALMPEAIRPAGWGVAMMLDTYDVMYDSKQVKEPVTSWLDFWRPEFKGKIALPSATDGGACFAFISCIMRAIGGEDRSDAVINETFNRLRALRPNVRVFYPDSTQPSQLIDRGDIAISPQFGIRIANQTRVSPHIVKATPKEGVQAIPYDLCLPKGSKNGPTARAYINFTLTKPIQESLMSSLFATPSRLGVDASPEIQKLVTLDPKKIWFPDEVFSASKQREWLDRFTRDVQS
jgi:putative spermidine/putrescine transport system substrate-binding protein